jgi:hypothetical protein
MKRFYGVAGILLVLSATSAWGGLIDQYASSVIAVSSEWSGGSWAAIQALGAPDTFGYGDISTAWSPSSSSGTFEYITLGFSTPVYADGVTIWETDGNGFVYQVDVLDLNDVLHMVWTGMDPSLPGTPVANLVTWTQTSFQVKGVKIYTDTSHSATDWEEIDAAQLHGNDTYTGTPEPGSILLLLGGIAGLGLCKARVIRQS